MTRKTRIIISLVLVLVAFAAGIAVFAESNSDRSAQADGTATTRYTKNTDGKIDPPPSDPTKAKGTAENPFFILEIVPYEAMGTIGYQIAGCEPINMQKAAYAGADIPGEGHTYTVASTRTEYLWASETKPSYYPDSPQIVTNVPQYGTMKYVSDGSGNYNMKADPVPNYLYVEAPDDYTGTRYKYVGGLPAEAADGNLMRLVQGGTAKYEPASGGTGGNYVWTPLDAQTCGTMSPEEAAQYNVNYDEKGEFKTVVEGVECYKIEGIKEYVHNNYFLKESVGLAYEFDDTGKRIPYVGGSGRPTLEEKIAAYHSVVYTVTPEDLNVVKNGVLVNKALIERADMISISSVDSTGVAVGIYEQFLGYNNVSYDSSGLKRELNRKILDGTDIKTTFKDNPLDWPAALEIYKRASSATDPLPIIWDTHTYSNFTETFKSNVNLKIDGKVDGKVNGSQDSMFKLYLMLYEMSTPLFESFFGDPASFPTVSYDLTFNVNGTNVTKTFTTPLLTDYKKDGNHAGQEGGQRYWANQTLYPWKSGILPNKTSLDDAANVAILDVLGIMNNGGGPMFHYNSGDAQNMVRNGIHIFDGSTYLTTGFMSDCGVDNDQYGREVYEYFESIQDPQPETDLSTAEVLYYLLNGLENGPGARNNYDYKVLELQPVAKYKGGTTSGTVTNDAFWRAFIANYANTTGNVTVDRMSTSEFIGKHVECTSEYDLIYIGVNTLSDNWCMDFSGTDFVYAHSGPVIQTDTQAMRGWFDPVADTAEQYFPLSGNDLTKLAEQQLIDFIQAGGPVLFGTGFYTNENATAINDNIDRNSNVYHFADTYATTPIYEYALSKTSTRVATENALRHGLVKTRRVFLTDVTTPRLYDEDASEANKYLSGENLNFRFKLNAPAGTKYQVELYIDNNGDGVFTEDERMSGVSVRQDGHGGDGSNIVYAGWNCVVSRAVEDRNGSVAWKLDLVNTSDFYAGTAPEVKDRIVHASLTGLSAIKEGTKESLRILQIMTPGNTLELPQDGEFPETMTEAQANTVKKKFWVWTRDINGLDLTFYRMTEDQLVPLLTDPESGNPDYLKDNYEMVILGFGDCYKGVTEEAVLNALEGFMEAGKAVLYTHDASSMIGTDDDASWGKEITKRFRDRYGMDRYDVSTYKAAEVLASGEKRADYPYVATAYESAIGKLLLRDGTGAEVSDTLGSDDGGYALTQGLTNGHIYRYLRLTSNLLTKKISKVNTGAITNYPYKIPDTIEIAKTHPQYYQLDMENEEVTVWYCLTGADIYEHPNDVDKIKSFYNSTSNDVRNNYYIYNYGNVTYSGMGHNTEMTDYEIKLFINTFVAAYRAAGRSTKIVVANNDATKNVTGGEYFLCVDVDSANSEALLGGEEMGALSSYRKQTAVDESNADAGYNLGEEVTATSKRVEFYIDDGGTVGASKYVLKFYLDGATDPTPLAVFRKSDGVFMDGKTSSTKLLAGAGNIYYVDVPMKLETVDGKTAVTTTKIKVEIEKTYKVGSLWVPAPPGNTYVNIIPRGLFDLD
ncbi:MAG: DUF5057 domain-containing protein [Lachnospiraceae bacterium]|nr:DUF5057 domain-containing protein [Lachnospiraceae bacterium]